MTMLMKIEEEIQELPEEEFGKLKEWFLDLESKRWDNQIENDSKSGKLDALANQAILDFQKGNFKSI